MVVWRSQVAGNQAVIPLTNPQQGQVPQTSFWSSWNKSLWRTFIPGLRLAEWCTTWMNLYLIILSIMEWNVWQMNSIYGWENPGSHWCDFRCDSTPHSRLHKMERKRIFEVKLHWRIQLGGAEGLGECKPVKGTHCFVPHKGSAASTGTWNPGQCRDKKG